jgi:hypothetical protein
MFNADFVDRTYTAEVLKCDERAGVAAFKSVVRLVREPKVETLPGEFGPDVKVGHGFLASKRHFHRAVRTRGGPDGEVVAIPRQIALRGQELNLYDVFVAQAGRHVIVAVPFHELAEEFFVRVDGVLAGSGTRYEKLDITAMIIRLGARGATEVELPGAAQEAGLSITRCHLAYADQHGRTSDLQQIRMTGGNVGASREYKHLISAVLKPSDSLLTVTPIVLGFAVAVGGVRKASASTDRHGNFKVWIAPGFRRLGRLFHLLNVVGRIENVTQTTTNVPILQSKAIREAEE